jgi:hypothetical protein
MRFDIENGLSYHGYRHTHTHTHATATYTTHTRTCTCITTPVPLIPSSHPPIPSHPFHPSSPPTHFPPSHLGVLRRTIHIDLGLGSSFSTLLISACTQNCPRCRPPTGMRMCRRLGCLFGLGDRCACTCAVVGARVRVGAVTCNMCVLLLWYVAVESAMW